MKISLEVDEEQHRYIKAAAALDGCSIKEFILSRVFTRKASCGDERAGAPSRLRVQSAGEIRAKIDEALRSPVLDGATAMAELREELRVKYGL